MVKKVKIPFNNDQLVFIDHSGKNPKGERVKKNDIFKAEDGDLIYFDESADGIMTDPGYGDYQLEAGSTTVYRLLGFNPEGKKISLFDDCAKDLDYITNPINRFSSFAYVNRSLRYLENIRQAGASDTEMQSIVESSQMVENLQKILESMMTIYEKSDFNEGYQRDLLAFCDKLDQLANILPSLAQKISIMTNKARSLKLRDQFNNELPVLIGKIENLKSDVNPLLADPESDSRTADQVLADMRKLQAGLSAYPQYQRILDAIETQKNDKASPADVREFKISSPNQANPGLSAAQIRSVFSDRMVPVLNNYLSHILQQDPSLNCDLKLRFVIAKSGNVSDVQFTFTGSGANNLNDQMINDLQSVKSQLLRINHFPEPNDMDTVIVEMTLPVRVSENQSQTEKVRTALESRKQSLFRMAQRSFIKDGANIARVQVMTGQDGSVLWSQVGKGISTNTEIEKNVLTMVKSASYPVARDGRAYEYYDIQVRQGRELQIKTSDDFE